MATALSFARATTTTTVQQMITSCSSLAAAAEESGDSRGCLMTLIPQGSQKWDCREEALVRLLLLLRSFGSGGGGAITTGLGERKPNQSFSFLVILFLLGCEF